MICEDVRAAMAATAISDRCEETDAGARVLTDCLYPSFEAVEVYVSRFGEGYRVTDSGRAFRSAWVHGRDESMTRRYAAREALKYHLVLDGTAFVGEARSAEWLSAAIVSVANASAATAHASVAKSAAAIEVVLRDKIFTTLSDVFLPREIMKEYKHVGSSGDARYFDYGVRASNDNLLLLNAVSPHHSSIFAKYVAFADTRDMDPRIIRLAVYDHPLDTGDISLLLQVVELVALKSLDPVARKAVAGER